MTDEEKKEDVVKETRAESKEEANAKAPAAKEAPEETKVEDKVEDAPAQEEAEAELAPEAKKDVLEEVADDAAEAEVEEVKIEMLNRDLRPGMLIRVYETIKDVSPKGEERSREQMFEGTILGLRGKGVGRTMTIRKVSKGYGVEKIFPLNAPTIAKVEIVKRHKVRQAKLKFLRGIFKRGHIKRRFKRKLKEIKSE